MLRIKRKYLFLPILQKLNKESMKIVLDDSSILSIMNRSPLSKTFEFASASKLFPVYKLLFWANFYKQKLLFLLLDNMMPVIC